MVHDWHRREERWGHPEMSERMLYKELGHRIASGDAEALRELAASAGIGRPHNLPSPTPPAVNIPPDLFTAATAAAKQEMEYLAPHIERAASAQHCLTKYVYDIVKAEPVPPNKS